MLNTLLHSEQVRRPEMRRTSSSSPTSNSTTASSGVPSSRHELGEGFGLRLRARKSVENETILRIGLRDPIANDFEHGRVVDQQPFGHDGIRALAELRALVAMFAQDVSGGDLRNSKLLDETLGLGALARSGRAHENDAHARFLT